MPFNATPFHKLKVQFHIGFQKKWDKDKSDFPTTIVCYINLKTCIFLVVDRSDTINIKNPPYIDIQVTLKKLYSI